MRPSVSWATAPLDFQPAEQRLDGAVRDRLVGVESIRDLASGCAVPLPEDLHDAKLNAAETEGHRLLSDGSDHLVD